MPVRPNPDIPNFRARRAAAGFALLVLCGAIALAVTSRAPAQSATGELSGKMDELQSNVSEQGDLQSRIEAQNREVNDLIAKESELRRKADSVQSELDELQGRLDQATAELNDEKAHLAEIRARLARAIDSLEALLVDIYKSNDPDTLSVIMESDSWQDLVNDSEYVDRLQSYDESVVERVSGLREEIAESVATLKDAQARIKVARDEVAVRRAELQKAQDDIGAQHSQLIAAREAQQASLSLLQAREKTLEDELGTSIPGPGERGALIDGDAVPPPNAPLVVKAVMEAANQINETPYVWGGGHGSFEDSGYDCSGAVSYALHGGGLLDSPMDSGGLTSWGSPGAGNWITVYANFGHVWMTVAGLRFDTGGPGGGNGPRWSTLMRSDTGSFTARHPEGF